MAGLFDFLGGGDTGGGLYGDALTPEQRQALQQRGLLGFMQGLQKSGALDYTAPFLSGKVPAGFAAGLAGGLGGAGEAMDSGALNAMRAQQLGLQGQMTRANLGSMQQENSLMQGWLKGGMGAQPGASPAAVPGTDLQAGGAVPSAAQGTAAMSPAEIKQAALDAGFQGEAADKITGITLAESSGNPGAIGDKDKGGSYGLTQINQNAWGPVAQSALNNPKQAMKLAFDISKGGADFSPWTTYRTGAYQKFLPAAQASAAPQGGLLGGPGADTLAPAAPAPQTSLLPPPAASAAPPQPMGGGMMANPMGIDPRQAAMFQMLRTGRGAAVPGFINDIAGLATAGPKAASIAAAEDPFKRGQMQFQSNLDINKGYALQPLEMQKLQETGAQARQTAGEAPSNLSPGQVRVLPPGSAGAKQYREAALRGGNPDNVKLGADGSVTVTGPSTNEDTFGKELAQTNVKSFFARRDVALDAAKSLENTTETRALLKGMGDLPGTGANFSLALRKGMTALGYPDDKVTNTESFIATRAQEVGRLVKMFGSGTGLSDADRQYATKMAAGDISLNKESISRILDITERVSRNVINEHNKDASKIDPKLSPFPLTVDMPASASAGRSGVTSSGVKWSVQ